VEYIQRGTIDKHLKEFGFFQQVGKDGFIPEGMLCHLLQPEMGGREVHRLATDIVFSLPKFGAFLLPVPE
jgi:hypothetical protein